MATRDLTIEILKSIRNEVKQTNARLDQTNARLDRTNASLDGLRDDVKQTNGRLESVHEDLRRQIVESEVRTATAIVDLAGTVGELIRVRRSSSDWRPRVERCEKDISDLKRRVG